MSSRNKSRSPKRHIKQEKRNDRSRSPRERRPEKDHDRRHKWHPTAQDHSDIKIELQKVKMEPHDKRRHESRDQAPLIRHPHDSGRSPHDRHSPPPRRRLRDQFQVQRDERRRNDRQRIESREQRDADNEVWGRGDPSEGEENDHKDKKKDKEKPSLALSGKLTEDTNTFRGVVIKYNEPPEARKPKKHWRFYPFKGETALPVLHLHRQSAFLLGRDRRVADIPVDHPSCSKQHAALQFRLVEYTRPDGRAGRRVRPYVIDLGSANGTYVNSQRIEAQHYVELLEKDVVKFGFSSREYVLLHDSSDTSELDDDEGVVD